MFSKKLIRNKLFESIYDKINAPTMAYLTVYGKMPFPPISGREAHHQTYNFNGILIDNHIPKTAIKNISMLSGIETRASCEGESDRLLTFLIFRNIDRKIETAKKIVKNLNKNKDIKSMWNIGQSGYPRICVSNKLWYSDENKDKFEKWWLRLPDIIRGTL